MNLYLVRHGETDWNKQRRIQGQVDIPLNEFGIHLAEETGKGLAGVHFDLCFSSPLNRAYQTAQIILEGTGTPIIKEDRIKELGFGVYEGKRVERQYREVPDSFDDFFTHPEAFVPGEGGESCQQLSVRVADFLAELVSRYGSDDQNIMVTSHGAAIAAMLNVIKQEPLSCFWGDGVHKNCAVSKIHYSGGEAEVIYEDKVFYSDEAITWSR